MRKIWAIEFIRITRKEEASAHLHANESTMKIMGSQIVAVRPRSGVPRVWGHPPKQLNRVQIIEKHN